MTVARTHALPAARRLRGACLYEQPRRLTSTFELRISVGVFLV